MGFFKKLSSIFNIGEKKDFNEDIKETVNEENISSVLENRFSESNETYINLSKSLYQEINQKLESLESQVEQLNSVDITKEISEANKRVYPLDYLKVLLPTA